LLIRVAAILISFNLLPFSFFGLGGDTVNFDNQKPGKLPANWTAIATHSTQIPDWEVRQDPTAPTRPNVFEQLSTSFGENEFPLAIFDKSICRDGDLSVKFKIGAGQRRIKEAGIVWRFQNPDNYYVLRFSANENNIAMFRVQNGQMYPIRERGAKPGSSAIPHDLRTGQWYVAKVIYRGPHFRVLVGNRELFDARDESIANAGKTGLWTRAGTTAAFDDFRIDKKG